MSELNDFKVLIHKKYDIKEYERESLQYLDQIGKGYSADNITIDGKITLSSAEDVSKLQRMLTNLKPCFTSYE